MQSGAAATMSADDAAEGFARLATVFDSGRIGRTFAADTGAAAAFVSSQAARVAMWREDARGVRKLVALAWNTCATFAPDVRP